MAFPVFLDTCVLYGGVLNDFILRLAESGAFRPLWSSGVLVELQRNLVAHGFQPAAVDRRIHTMRTFFPDAMVDGYEHLIEGMTCDPKDRHVLAAAVRANAEILVTFNLRDFPEAATSPFDIEVVHPDAFLQDQLDLFPGLTMRALQDLSEDYNAPPMSIEDVLGSLSRAGVGAFAQEVTSRFLD